MQGASARQDGPQVQWQVGSLGRAVGVACIPVGCGGLWEQEEGEPSSRSPRFPASEGGRRPARSLSHLVTPPQRASLSQGLPPGCPGAACRLGTGAGDWRPAPPREGCFPRRPPQAGLEETRPGGLLPFSLPEPRPQWTEPARPARDSWPSARGGAGGRPRWCPRADAAAEVCQPVRRPSGPPGADGGGTGSCWLHAVMAHASSPSSDCRGGLWGGALSDPSLLLAAEWGCVSPQPRDQGPGSEPRTVPCPDSDSRRPCSQDPLFRTGLKDSTLPPCLPWGPLLRTPPPGSTLEEPSLGQFLKLVSALNHPGRSPAARDLSHQLRPPSGGSSPESHSPRRLLGLRSQVIQGYTVRWVELGFETAPLLRTVPSSGPADRAELRASRPQSPRPPAHAALLRSPQRRQEAQRRRPGWGLTQGAGRGPLALGRI